MVALADQRTRLLADVMLGSLARWLRVLGYDTWMQCSHERTLAEKEPVIANDEHSALREEVAAIWDHLIMEKRHVNG